MFDDLDCVSVELLMAYLEVVCNDRNEVDVTHYRDESWVLLYDD